MNASREGPFGDYACRDDVVVATRFPARSEEEIEQGITGQEHAITMLERSLQNLGMDYVDLYICHVWDSRTLVREIMDGLAQGASRQGEVCGHIELLRMAAGKANVPAGAAGYPRFVSVQGHYNLIFREEEREIGAPLPGGWHRPDPMQWPRPLTGMSGLP